jgi:SpoVK/Ycf46/Vps4 family AAA+-type ATPase
MVVFACSQIEESVNKELTENTNTASDDARPRSKVPDWYPTWARELAEMYFSGSSCMFVLHGNTNDLVHAGATGPSPYCTLPDFLADQMFGSWDIILTYDLGGGLRVQAGKDSSRLQEMVNFVSGQIGNRLSWPRDPDKALDALERIVQRNLLEENTSQRKRIAILFQHAQFLIPTGNLATLARGQASRLVRFISWAQNPYIKRINMSFCLITEKLSEINERLVQNAHVTAIEVPLPGSKERKKFIEVTTGDQQAQRLGEMSLAGLTQLSSGLNLVNLNVALSRTASDGKSIDIQRFRRMKKDMIERQCQGLVSFVEPGHDLGTVVGHTAAKKRLQQDGKWISDGRLDAAPMGYLICGPVGTGKSFLAECYAGSIGIPCVVLRNFRSKYVGETEGNLEQVLTVLRSLGPVVVIVDEADAALGDRGMDGDSGTSGRVFSMIASQMGNTRYRGRIVWMLLTSRPDMLPIDIKRQGRAEVHIPLFYPQETEEIQEMFRVMARKNKIELGENAIPDVPAERNLSGADIESIMLNAKRRVMSDDRETVDRADLEYAFNTFIPSAQGLEKELQELVAVLECTDREFLPADWREKVDAPEGRSQLQKRLHVLREMIDTLM